MYYSFIFIPLFISYICIHRKFTGTTKKYIHEHFDKWNMCTVLYMVPPNKTDCTKYIHCMYWKNMFISMFAIFCNTWNVLKIHSLCKNVFLRFAQYSEYVEGMYSWTLTTDWSGHPPVPSVPWTSILTLCPCQVQASPESLGGQSPPVCVLAGSGLSVCSLPCS